MFELATLAIIIGIIAALFAIVSHPIKIYEFLTKNRKN